ncbi:hypothetical protein KCU69_g22, partial [Aureobasidium melanogenum]
LTHGRYVIPRVRAWRIEGLTTDVVHDGRLTEVLNFDYWQERDCGRLHLKTLPTMKRTLCSLLVSMSTPRMSPQAHPVLTVATAHTITTLHNNTMMLLVALVIDYFFFMLSGLLMFYSLVHVMQFIGFFHRDEIPWREVLTIGYIVRDVFLYFYIAISLEALLLHALNSG